ncbi:hypothetical protein V5O48_011068 [Marasmius crinis-equi]|uniref:Uncharacterized protein n=1 Tax=Marasmius crinis-equi TaxID=585013 RepID=A0ABR3F6K5_9AGAR
MHVDKSAQLPTPFAEFQDTMPPLPFSISFPSTNAAEGNKNQLTRSQHYESLLFGYGLGYPLWDPTPRQTRAGEEYVVNIGDVGVIPGRLPFNTLFNITQPPDSLANRDGIPLGVDPPCPINPRWLTVIEKYHQEETLFVRPKQSISSQNAEDLDGKRVFNLTLNRTPGVLLLLPQGGALEVLEQKGKFTLHIQQYWRYWFDWAEQQGDLSDHQGLYVVTGVEKCPAWVIAAWDEDATMTSSDDSQSQTLTFELMGDGTCNWRRFPPARCEKRSFTSRAGDPPKESVFIRGFWIDRSSGVLSGSMPSPCPPPQFGGDDSGRSSGQSQGPSSSTGPSSNLSSLFPPPATSSRYSGTPDSHSNTTDLATDMLVYDLNLDLSGDYLGLVRHPCQTINKLAFDLISKTCPSLLESGCIAFSHDEDWMSIASEFGDELLWESDLIRRVCNRFKFVVEGGKS